MRALRLVTTNPGKVEEFRRLLAPSGLEVEWVRRRLPEIQAETLDEVARTKLEAVRRLPGAVVVEDSGLFVSALGGFPGVYSAYALRTLGLRGILRLVDGRARRAEYRATVGVRSRGHVTWFHGRCPGRLAAEPQGAHGFGFDPIFVPTGSRRTFGELPPEEKDRVSHRGKAVRGLARAFAAGRLQ